MACGSARDGRVPPTGSGPSAARAAREGRRFQKDRRDGLCYESDLLPATDAAGAAKGPRRTWMSALRRAPRAPIREAPQTAHRDAGEAPSGWCVCEGSGRRRCCGAAGHGRGLHSTRRHADPARPALEGSAAVHALTGAPPWLRAYTSSPWAAETLPDAQSQHVRRGVTRRTVRGCCWDAWLTRCRPRHR